MDPRILAAGSAALLLFGPVAAQDDARQRTISPKAGAEARYRSTQVQKQIMAAMDQESTNELTTDVHVKVDDVAEDGTVTATATWLRVRGKLAAMGMEYEFDSKDPEAAADNPMFGGLAEAVAAVAGQKATLRFGPDGKIRDDQPLRDLAARAADKVTGQARMLLKNSLGPRVFEEQASVFGAFPTTPVAAGGTWTEEKDIRDRGGLPLTSEITRKLERADDEAVVVSFTGTLKMAPKAVEGEAAAAAEDDDDEHAAMMQQMLRDAKIDGGKVAGETKISGKDGMLVQSRSTMNMRIEMPNVMGGDEPFVVEIEQKTTTERVAPDAVEDAAAPKK
jgi:hypothetical protein